MSNIPNEEIKEEVKEAVVEVTEEAGEPVPETKRVKIKKEKQKVEFKEGLKDIKKIETIAIKDIDLEDRSFQYRLFEKTTDLLPSLMQDGQLVPVILWGTKPPYKIIDGYRRVAAINNLGWPSVRAIVRTDLDEEGAYRLSFIENVKRKNYTALDMAHALWKLQARGKSDEQLTAEFGISKRQIQRYLQLIEFPQEIKAALAAEQITMAHAQMLNQFEVNELDPWLEKIANGLSARQLKRELKKGELEPKRKPTQYFKTEPSGFRIFPLRFSFNMSEAKQKKILQVLKDAVKIIESKSAE